MVSDLRLLKLLDWDMISSKTLRFQANGKRKLIRQISSAAQSHSLTKRVFKKFAIDV